MKNKGFTLIEILGVLVILGLVTVIAVPAIQTISSKIKNNLVNSTIKLVRSNYKLCKEDGHCKDSTLGSTLVPAQVQELCKSGYLNWKEPGKCIPNPYCKDKTLDCVKLSDFESKNNSKLKSDWEGICSNQPVCTPPQP